MPINEWYYCKSFYIVCARAKDCATNVPAKKISYMDPDLQGFSLQNQVIVWFLLPICKDCHFRC